jgi:hypothetical protein
MKVSRRPLRTPRRPSAFGFLSLLRAPGSVATAFALVASLAPLGTVARAQSASKSRELSVVEGPSYVIEQTPDGDASCRLAMPGETAAASEQTQFPLRQINHLEEKEGASASASAGLIIILRATPRLEANTAAKQAFINAAAKWEALISTQITVTIDVDYGPDFFGNTSKPYGSDTLGQTSASGFIPTYSSVRQRLINRAPAGSEEAVLLNNLPASSLPTDEGNVTTVFIENALARTLGYSFSEEDNEATIPKIGFNTKFPFDFDYTDGYVFDPVAGRYPTDFDSVAVHEIGHALGFTSRVGFKDISTNPDAFVPYATIWDFYRFSPGTASVGNFATAQRLLKTGVGTGARHVHFSGGAELDLSTGNPQGEGGDGEQASHWKDDTNGLPFIGIMDPTMPTRRHEEITANDLRAIDFFGYTMAGVAPPPPPAAPANDNFANAQTISGSAGSVTGTNVAATRETGEQNHSPASDAGGKSVWYNWTAPSAGSVTFNTSNTNYDTVLAAYTGASVGSLTALGKNDDVASGNTNSSVTFNAAGGTTYRIAVDGWDGEQGTFTLNWAHTPSGGGGQPSVVSFSTHNFFAAENGGAAAITLIRSNPGSELRVGVRTVDNPAAVPCSDTTTTVAFARCDYATTVETVTFGPNETSKTVSVPLIDDSYGEPDETVQLQLFIVDPGVQFGVVPATTLFITSNESQTGANPIAGVPFFVRQHYLDFLSREPEAGEPWSAVLNNCADQFNQSLTSPSVGCDRLTVSAAFFGSPEFNLKARYAFRFYKVAFGRLPEYAEIVVDMRQLTGATGQEVIDRRAAFPGAFVQRTDFVAAFGAMSNADFVNTLMNRYGQNLLLINSRNPSDPENGQKIGLSRTGMTAALNNGQWTRAQVLRAIADSDEVSAAEFRPGTVAIQYYGYLRRTPEPGGYQNWLNYLNAHPDDSRTMVNGFLNSQEYGLRFGPQ